MTAARALQARRAASRLDEPAQDVRKGRVRGGIAPKSQCVLTGEFALGGRS